MSNINVGDTVFVTDTAIDPEYMGKHAEVLTVDQYEGSSLPLFVRFTREDGTTHSTWIHAGTFNVAQPDTDAPTRRYSLPANMTLEEARFIIDRMEADFRELQEKHDLKEKLRDDAVTRLSESQRRYSHDMGAIQDIMREVKEEQSWCDDGYNGVVERVNEQMQGGWQFDTFRRLVRKTVSVRGETVTDVEVWVYEGEDEEDTDYWKDGEGDDISDPDEWMQDALKEEFRRCGGFDTVEVQ